jgi:hypothetical protein
MIYTDEQEKYFFSMMKNRSEIGKPIHFSIEEMLRTHLQQWETPTHVMTFHYHKWLLNNNYIEHETFDKLDLDLQSAIVIAEEKQRMDIILRDARHKHRATPFKINFNL